MSETTIDRADTAPAPRFRDPSYGPQEQLDYSRALVTGDQAALAQHDEAAREGCADSARHALVMGYANRAAELRRELRAASIRGAASDRPGDVEELRQIAKELAEAKGVLDAIGGRALVRPELEVGRAARDARSAGVLARRADACRWALGLIAQAEARQTLGQDGLGLPQGWTVEALRRAVNGWRDPEVVQAETERWLNREDTSAGWDPSTGEYWTGNVVREGGGPRDD